MLISDDKQFIFVHNPKAAGSSIRNALMEFDSYNNRFWHHEYYPVLERIVDKAHMPLLDIKLAAPNVFAYFEQYFSFGFCRNPYDKVYSAFQEKKRDWQLAGDIEFNSYVQDNLNASNIRYDWNFCHFIPQYHFFYLNNKIIVDYIGRFENINRDYIYLHNILDLNKSEDLPKINTSNIKKTQQQTHLPQYIEYFDDRSIQLVNELYDKDFVFLGYDKLISNYNKGAEKKDNNQFEAAVKQDTCYIKGLETFYEEKIKSIKENHIQKEQDLLAQCKSLAESKDELELKHDALVRARANQDQDNADALLAINELKAINQELVSVNNNYVEENKRQAIQLANFYSSRSWKLTAPLRALKIWSSKSPR